MPINIESITVYPVKSTQGMALHEASVLARGLENDRRWMLVDPDGQFITARQYPALLGVRARPQGLALLIEMPARRSLLIDNAQANLGPVQVRIWRSELTVQRVDPRADEWFSELLGVPCQLVFMAEQHERAVNPEFARAHDIVSFADGYPLLLCSESSLADLNGRAPIEASMTRFRPNVSVTGAAPFAEDRWRRIRLGKVEFDVAKPCDRCVVTTINPQSLQPDAQREPLHTLAQYRNDRERGILFGMNLIPRGTGVICVGDPVTLLD